MKKYLSTIGLIIAAPVFGQNTFFQDFETDASGMNEVLASGELPGNLFRTNNSQVGNQGYLAGNIFASVNPNAIPGANSTDWYLELDMLADFPDGSYGPIQGPRVSWNNPSDPLDPFVSGNGHRIAVYVDDADALDPFNLLGPDLYPENTGWFWQPGLTDANALTRSVAGGFGVRSIDIGGGDLEWFAMADGNGTGYDQTQVDGGLPSQQLSQGWYNFETVWVEDLLGNIDEINRIYTNDFGSLLFEYTRQDVALASAVGGLGNVSVGSGSDQGGGLGTIPSNLTILGIDEIGTVVPESGTAFLIVLCSVFALSRRNRRVFA